MAWFPKGAILGAVCFLSACSLVQYQPLSTIQKVDLNTGYRFEQAFSQRANDDLLMFVVISGGGTRAAALGYGVLEELNQQRLPHRQQSLLEEIDLVYGVSGGSVLAVYFALHGKETIPSFERRFLKQNFQRQMTKQIFSAANLLRLTSPEFGRGDLLQEQFENTLFKNATFGDLEKHRKGPFAVISATDMAMGSRFDFTQERFDSMCLNLSDLRLARAVAASSAVPLVFSPITLNNHGGNCGYQLPEPVQAALQQAQSDAALSNLNRREIGDTLARQYHNSKQRPYIHLLDGGCALKLDFTIAHHLILSTLQQPLGREEAKRLVHLLLDRLPLLGRGGLAHDASSAVEPEDEFGRGGHQRSPMPLCESKP